MKYITEQYFKLLNLIGQAAFIRYIEAISRLLLNTDILGTNFYIEISDCHIYFLNHGDLFVFTNVKGVVLKPGMSLISKQEVTDFHINSKC